MKSFIAHASLAALIVLGTSTAAAADGKCGTHGNEPCPDKETLINRPTAQRASDSAASMDVQAGESDETAAKRLPTAAELKKVMFPPKENCGLNSAKPCKPCGLNSPTACAEETSPARTDVNAQGSRPAPPRARVAGLNSKEKLDPPPPNNEKEPAD